MTPASVPSVASPRRVPLASSLTPAQAVGWLRGLTRAVALTGDWLGVEALLAADPVWLAGAEDDPFTLLDLQPRLEIGGAGTDGVRVGGGWLGWFGYGLGARIEVLPPPPPAPIPRPEFALAFYDHIVVCVDGAWCVEMLWTPERADALEAACARWGERLASAPPPSPPASVSFFGLCGSGAAGHRVAVAQGVERIHAGEIFQANLCLRLEGEVAPGPEDEVAPGPEDEVAPGPEDEVAGGAGARAQARAGVEIDLFTAALDRVAPRFGAAMDGVVSLSPERFLRRVGDRVWSEPIKGTRPRPGSDDSDPSASAAVRAELLSSVKDAAEHVMIVDLMRNDLGRVCAYGSVRTEPLRAEAHDGVWHLVSTVTGQLRPGTGDGALLGATFPPGSVTGAPKVQAMRVIAELESTARALYTGAIGIASPMAGLDLSVAIRTFELAAGRIWLGVGGGVVADSDPQAELEEALTKAAGPLRAIGAELAEPAAAGRPPSQARHGSYTPAAGQSSSGIAPARFPRALDFGDRPDPAAGLLETVLVEDGVPVRLEPHLARATASLAKLHGVAVAASVAHQARALAQTAPVPGRARLRIVWTPHGETTLELIPAPAPRRTGVPVPLVPFILPGGLGAHKWADRSLLDALTRTAAGAVPLLLDTDGSVLEAAWANVWIQEGSRWITPPADGRLLPGDTRAMLLARGDAGGVRYVSEPVSWERLRAAEAVALSASVSGWRPASVERDVRGGDEEQLGLTRRRGGVHGQVRTVDALEQTQAGLHELTGLVVDRDVVGEP